VEIIDSNIVKIVEALKSLSSTVKELAERNDKPKGKERDTAARATSSSSTVLVASSGVASATQHGSGDERPPEHKPDKIDSAIKAAVQDVGVFDFDRFPRLSLYAAAIARKMPKSWQWAQRFPSMLLSYASTRQPATSAWKLHVDPRVRQKIEEADLQLSAAKSVALVADADRLLGTRLEDVLQFKQAAGEDLFVYVGRCRERIDDLRPALDIEGQRYDFVKRVVMGVHESSKGDYVAQLSAAIAVCTESPYADANDRLRDLLAALTRAKQLGLSATTSKGTSTSPITINAIGSSGRYNERSDSPRVTRSQSPSPGPRAPSASSSPSGYAARGAQRNDRNDRATRSNDRGRDRTPPARTDPQRQVAHEGPVLPCIFHAGATSHGLETCHTFWRYMARARAGDGIDCPVPHAASEQQHKMLNCRYLKSCKIHGQPLLDLKAPQPGEGKGDKK